MYSWAFDILPGMEFVKPMVINEVNCVQLCCNLIPIKYK